MMKMTGYLHALLASPALFIAGPTNGQTEQDRVAIANELMLAEADGDWERMRAGYLKVSAILAADPNKQTADGLAIQANLQRMIARATHGSGVGDPCPHIRQATELLKQSRAQFFVGESEDRDAAGIIDGIAQNIGNDAMRMNCRPSGAEQPAVVGTPDQSMAGTYYLSGVMETGSVLNLTADGRFSWSMSYGAVDQTAEGRWGRAGDIITLATDEPSADKPIFILDEVFPWSAEIERRMRERESMQQWDIFNTRCPPALRIQQVPSVPWPMSTLPANAADRAKAAQAKQAAEAARDKASRAIAKSMAADASEADLAEAEAAISAWYSARYEMEKAHSFPDLQRPDIGSPLMPDECRMPDIPSEEPVPEAQWRRGIAAAFGNATRDMVPYYIQVTFVFSDGHRETTTTGSSSMAFAPPRKGAVVEQLLLELAGPLAQPVTLPVEPAAEGVLAVLVDTTRITAPPFETMRLEIEGRDLIPDGKPDGRYIRE